MPEQPASSARLRRIGRTLQELREAKGWSQQRSGLRLERSGSSLSLIENGLQPLRIRDLKYILDVYGVSDPTLSDALLTLAEQDRQTGWWHDFKDVLSPTALDYASLENDASSIEMAELAFIPGLFQTDDYTRAIMKARGPESPPDMAERFVAFRMGRQQILRKPQPPSIRTIIDEAALHRLRGGRKVMRAQLQRLIEESHQTHLAVRVLPFTCASDPGFIGPFQILKIGHPSILSIVLMDHLTGRWILEDGADIANYRAKFNHIEELALSETDSRDLIHRIASDL